MVDGVPVMLPSYDEAVNGGVRASGPGYLASVGQGCPLPVDDQSPPAYPGSGDMDMGTGGSEACDSGSASSELLQSLYSPAVCLGGTHPDGVDTGAGTTGETASSSPGIDIADGECWPRTRRQASLPPEPLLVALPACVPAIQSGRAAGPVLGFIVSTRTRMHPSLFLLWTGLWGRSETVTTHMSRGWVCTVGQPRRSLIHQGRSQQAGANRHVCLAAHSSWGRERPSCVPGEAYSTQCTQEHLSRRRWP